MSGRVHLPASVCVQLWIVYLTEGCGEPKTNKRCNPWYGHTDGHDLNKNECCRCPRLEKIATFSVKDSAKTLSKCYCPAVALQNNTKISK